MPGYVRGRTVEQRLLDLSIPEPNSGCLLWMGAVSPTSNYGCFSIGKLRTSAHKAAYLTWRGPVPEGHEVCHGCNNRLCIEPSHRYTDTRAGNHQYKVDCGRTPASTMHRLPTWVAYHWRCKGHPYRGSFDFHGHCHSAGYFATPQEAHEAAKALREKVKAEYVARAN